MPAHERQGVGERLVGKDGDRIDRWMTPMPPACAMAIARRASVTVSMAEEMIGMLSEMERVSRVLMSTALGMTSEWPGVSRTSSKVRASLNEPFANVISANTCSYAAAWSGPRRRIHRRNRVGSGS
jgi:hypothetical protein